MKKYILLPLIIVIMLATAISIARNNTSYTNKNIGIRYSFTPTAWLDYTALDTTTYKDEVKGRLYLNDVEIPVPPNFGGSSCIWTHIALARSDNMNYLVEIGLRRIEINWIFYVEVDRQIFITYHDINNGKRTEVIRDNINLGTYYYVRIARLALGSDVWMIGIYSYSGNVLEATAIESKNTHATYIARSQLEFSAPSNTILEPSYTLVNDNAWLFWGDDEMFHEFDGTATLHGTLNIDFASSDTWYISWVK